ncbi:MAG TPA: hypothetical protein PK765_05740 [bacterium]|nr:hypothetical protein [bacterium]
MAAFTKAAQTVAGYSATQAQKEGKGEFMRKMRSAYTELANKFMRVVGQMATIRDKMPSKTPTVVS